MINKLKVQCFKSIESVELELGHVNVFIGANGCGKSNLLEALGVIAAAAFGRVDEESLVRRGCRPGGIFEPMFQHTPIHANTSIEAFGGNESYSIRLNNKHDSPRVRGWAFESEIVKSGQRTIVERPNLDGTSTGDPQVGLAALKLAEIDANDPAAIFLKTLSAYNIYSPDTPVLRGLMQDAQLREPVGLSGGRLAEAVSELIKTPQLYTKLTDEFRLSFEWFENFFPLEPPPKKDDPKLTPPRLTFLDRYFRADKKGARYLLLVNEINEGALYFLFVSALCLHPAAPKLFALDNADHGMNPLLARRLIDKICHWLLEGKEARQVLMTTHNPLVLDGLPLQDERVRLFTVDRDSKGTTCVKRFIVTDEHRKLAQEKEWPLSRMWVNGLIGGVPNV
jgi:energy-coupling factor transporter ATP-binding protein EcfA2